MSYTTGPCVSVYRERNLILALLAVVCRITELADGTGPFAYRAFHDVNDISWDDEWRNIIVLETEEMGQMTWHIHDSELPNFEKLPLRTDYRWDGHTTEEKYQRLLDWVQTYG
jgi:hypothetical protein